MRTSSLLKPGLAAVVAAAICALIVLGCGGSSSSDGQAVESDFVKQANAVCAEAEKEVQGEVATYLKSNGIKEIGEGESPGEAKARQIEVVEEFGIPTLRKQQTEIEALGLPREDGAQVKAYLAALKEEIEEGERKPAFLYSSSQKVFAGSDKIAGELGLEACSNR